MKNLPTDVYRHSFIYFFFFYKSISEIRIFSQVLIRKKNFFFVSHLPHATERPKNVFNINAIRKIPSNTNHHHVLNPAILCAEITTKEKKLLCV